MTGAPPAPAPSLILTRVCDGAAAPEASQVMRQFPPRPRPGAWPATGLDREQVSGAAGGPFPLDSSAAQRQRAASLKRVLDWLGSQPGATWQERWIGVRSRGYRPVAGPGCRRLTPPRTRARPGGLLLLICGDVIRPGMQAGCWTAPGLRLLTAEMARTRDPAGFTRLRKPLRDRADQPELIRDLSLRRIAAIMATKGGAAGDITAGDCLELRRAAERDRRRRGARECTSTSCSARPACSRPARRPACRMFATRGQLSPGRADRPVRHRMPPGP